MLCKWGSKVILYKANDVKLSLWNTIALYFGNNKQTLNMIKRAVSQSEGAGGQGKGADRGERESKEERQGKRETDGNQA